MSYSFLSSKFRGDYLTFGAGRSISAATHHLGMWTAGSRRDQNTQSAHAIKTHNQIPTQSYPVKPPGHLLARRSLPGRHGAFLKLWPP